MEFTCRFNLCHLAEKIISREFNTPDLTKASVDSGEYDKARYFYVYICRVHLDAPFLVIRESMPVYKYPKTVYQVFKRMYERRKKEDNEFIINMIKRDLDKEIEAMRLGGISLPIEGKQMKMNFA